MDGLAPITVFTFKAPVTNDGSGNDLELSVVLADHAGYSLVYDPDTGVYSLQYTPTSLEDTGLKNANLREWITFVENGETFTDSSLPDDFGFYLFRPLASEDVVLSVGGGDGVNRYVDGDEYQEYSITKSDLASLLLLANFDAILSYFPGTDAENHTLEFAFSTASPGSRASYLSKFSGAGVSQEGASQNDLQTNSTITSLSTDLGATPNAGETLFTRVEVTATLTVLGAPSVTSNTLVFRVYDDPIADPTTLLTENKGWHQINTSVRILNGLQEIVQGGMFDVLASNDLQINVTSETDTSFDQEGVCGCVPGSPGDFTYTIQAYTASNSTNISTVNPTIGWYAIPGSGDFTYIGHLTVPGTFRFIDGLEGIEMKCLTVADLDTASVGVNSVNLSFLPESMLADARVTISISPIDVGYVRVGDVLSTKVDAVLDLGTTEGTTDFSSTVALGEARP